MPLYMDRHDVPGASPEDVANAHLSDIALSSKYDVEFFSYWFDPDEGIVSCFARAPAKENMLQIHAESHGLIPAEVIEVSEDNVLQFLGGVRDPVKPSDITSPFRTIMFTDIEASTSLLNRIGQTAYVSLLADHDLIIRRSIVTWKGREVKHTGDGFLLSFDEGTDAMSCALEIDRAFDKRTKQNHGQTLRVKIGLDAGEPVDHNDDIFGTAVTSASRICEAARPGHILVSDVVRQLGEGQGFTFDAGRKTELKGFSEPTQLFEVLSGALGG
ncbi:MAG: adenylate/guanylate cyclase domain-containing protein [Acidimicrobiia bacterium]